MVRGWKAVLAVAGLAVLGAIPSVTLAQDNMQSDSMKKDDAMQDGMKHRHDEARRHGAGQECESAVYRDVSRQGAQHERARDGLSRHGRQENPAPDSFQTSNGPDVHVILVATRDAKDDANFLSGNVERIELGKLKGNEGDQNYELPENLDLSKFQRCPSTASGSMRTLAPLRWLNSKRERAQGCPGNERGSPAPRNDNEYKSTKLDQQQQMDFRGDCTASAGGGLWEFRPEKCSSTKGERGGSFAPSEKTAGLYGIAGRGKRIRQAGERRFIIAGREKLLRLSDFATSNGPEVHVVF